MFQRIPILRRASRCGAATGLGMLLAAGPTSTPTPPGCRYDFPGAVIQTDLPPSAAREAGLRLGVLRPLLADAAWGWPAIPAQPRFIFDVDFFRDAAAFTAAGGPAGAAGVFLPDAGFAPAALPGHFGRILAIAGPVLTLQTWHVLQHEAVHQYAYAACGVTGGPPLPPWLDEGLAEYVGEALFTGDGYQLGVIPPWRLARLRRELLSGELSPLQAMLAESRAQWAQRLSVARYDQVWALVHFLKNADGGRLAPLLAECVRRRTADPLPSDVESQFRSYWLSQPPDPTADRYARCVQATLTAVLDRAAAAGQAFSSFDAFIAAAPAGQIRIPDSRWLPPSLLTQAIDAAPACGTWRLVNTGLGKYRLDVALPNGVVLRGG